VKVEKMINVSIIVVSYNTREMTLECLRSVYEQTTEVSFELLVVDNASNDNSAAIIAEYFPECTLIASKENLGFAGANNLAAKQAKGEYLLLLNPDTIVLDGAIQKLYAFARENPKNLIYGGRTLYSDYSLNPTSCWRRPTLWSLFCYATGLTSIFRKKKFFDPESYGNWQRDSVREVDIVTGCLLMIDKKNWNRLGGFDLQFFMYGEDADLCLRAAEKGAMPIITPDATIIHYCGASEKVRADKMIRLFRAKEQLIRRHWNLVSIHLGLMLLRSSVLIRVVTCQIITFFLPNRSNKNAESWKEIWQRRKEWQTS
jgi:GT2 family glycosyltransferase